jgi:hypothetical protein
VALAPAANNKPWYSREEGERSQEHTQSLSALFLDEAKRGHH